MQHVPPKFREKARPTQFHHQPGNATVFSARPPVTQSLTEDTNQPPARRPGKRKSVRSTIIISDARPQGRQDPVYHCGHTYQVGEDARTMGGASWVNRLPQTSPPTFRSCPRAAGALPIAVRYSLNNREHLGGLPGTRYLPANQLGPP